jgi:hypothetical protein
MRVLLLTMKTGTHVGIRHFASTTQWTSQCHSSSTATASNAFFQYGMHMSIQTRLADVLLTAAITLNGHQAAQRTPLS